MENNKPDDLEKSSGAGYSGYSGDSKEARDLSTKLEFEGCISIGTFKGIQRKHNIFNGDDVTFTYFPKNGNIRLQTPEMDEFIEAGQYQIEFYNNGHYWYMSRKAGAPRLNGARIVAEISTADQVYYIADSSFVNDKNMKKLAAMITGNQGYHNVETNMYRAGRFWLLVLIGGVIGLLLSNILAEIGIFIGIFGSIWYGMRRAQNSARKKNLFYSQNLGLRPMTDEII